jgi:hypothetical protein
LAVQQRSINIVFDQTLGPKVARAIIEVLKLDKSVDLNAVSMADWAGPSAKDEDWCIRARDERRFVVTGDRGRLGIGAPLHLLLPYVGVSAAYLTPSLQSRSGIEQARAVVSVWPDLKEASGGTAGARYSIGISRDAFSWSDWELKEHERKRQEAELGRFSESLFQTDEGESKSS